MTDKLANLEKRFSKSHTEIADLYVRCSGDLKKMRDYLSGKDAVVLWDVLEDLALQKPDDSPEFAVLLESKGWEEIQTRRAFLKTNPRYAQGSAETTEKQ